MSHQERALELSCLQHKPCRARAAGAKAELGPGPELKWISRATGGGLRYGCSGQMGSLGVLRTLPDTKALPSCRVYLSSGHADHAPNCPGQQASPSGLGGRFLSPVLDVSGCH